MFRGIAVFALIMFLSSTIHARDFENNYAAYGAGAQPCGAYVTASEKGGRQQDYFIDWLIGYLSAFNVIMPETYDILGETEFDTNQRWLINHCRKYPKELFINAVARLTEVLYPTRYKAGLKTPPKSPPSTDGSKPQQVAKPRPQLKDIKIR